MRQLTIAVILLLTVTGSTIAKPLPAHTPINIPAFKGMDNFISTFPQASDVECKGMTDFTEVNFTWNGMKLQTFYDKEGNHLATSREILPADLPVSIQIGIKNSYAGYMPVEAIEYNDDNDGLSYYVTVKNTTTDYVLHITANGNISVFKKMKH